MFSLAMPDTSPQDIPEPADWEAFYKGYRKPGYITGYEILHKLGGGVFGIVYKARKQSIGKAYAIKFLKVDDHGVRSQVLAEMDMVKLFACVDHPNLVSIEDMGSIDGIPFITMGFAGEETLKSRLEEGNLSEEEALRLFVQMARGVQALHEHSLSHFDLKPANIFLKGDIARVGDYGLSKLVTESCMSLTFGRGTPYYMAPEIMSRKGDQRSDIYSLGVILFECLCGEVPFQGETEWEVIEGHRNKPLECPHHLSVQYRRILERMMAKDPADRYPSIAHMLRDLRRKDRLGESLVLEFGTGELGLGTGESRSGRSSLPPRPRVEEVRDHAPEPVPVLAGAGETERDILRVDLPERYQRGRRQRSGRGALLASVGALAAVFLLGLTPFFFVAKDESSVSVAQKKWGSPVEDEPVLDSGPSLSRNVRVANGTDGITVTVRGKTYALSQEDEAMRLFREQILKSNPQLVKLTHKNPKAQKAALNATLRGMGLESLPAVVVETVLLRCLDQITDR